MEWVSGSQKRGISPIKKPEHPDWHWLHSKQDAQYLAHLTDLAMTLKMLFPDEEVTNPYEQLEKEVIEKLENRNGGYVQLYKLLLEGITKLHHPYRHRRLDKWQIEKSDIVLTLRLLQSQIVPQSLISRTSKRVYQSLIEHFYPEDYKMREAMMVLRIPKSTLYRHLVILEKSGYIERVGGDRKKGYWYNVGPRRL